MNPIIAHDLMQARIADLHRPPGRTSTGSRKHPAIARLCWTAIALVAGAMVFLAGAPAALAVRVPPPGGSAGTQVAPPLVVNPAAARHPRLADRADRGRQRPGRLRAHPAGRPRHPARHPGPAHPLMTPATRPGTARPPSPGGNNASRRPCGTGPASTAASRTAREHRKKQQ